MSETIDPMLELRLLLEKLNENEHVPKNVLMAMFGNVTLVESQLRRLKDYVGHSTMALGGFAKLLEEMGELSQIVGKMLAFPDTDEHPDGKGSMKRRLEEEIADLQAALSFVTQKHALDQDFIVSRWNEKLSRFLAWDKGEKHDHR